MSLDDIEKRLQGLKTGYKERKQAQPKQSELPGAKREAAPKLLEPERNRRTEPPKEGKDAELDVFGDAEESSAPEATSADATKPRAVRPSEPLAEQPLSDASDSSEAESGANDDLNVFETDASEESAPVGEEKSRPHLQLVGSESTEEGSEDEIPVHEDGEVDTDGEASELGGEGSESSEGWGDLAPVATVDDEESEGGVAGVDEDDSVDEWPTPIPPDGTMSGMIDDKPVEGSAGPGPSSEAKTVVDKPPAAEASAGEDMHYPDEAGAEEDGDAARPSLPDMVGQRPAESEAAASSESSSRSESETPTMNVTPRKWTLRRVLDALSLKMDRLIDYAKAHQMESAAVAGGAFISLVGLAVGSSLWPLGVVVPALAVTGILLIKDKTKNDETRGGNE